jgi:hypothetical protein
MIKEEDKKKEGEEEDTDDLPTVAVPIIQYRKEPEEDWYWDTL